MRSAIVVVAALLALACTTRAEKEPPMRGRQHAFEQRRDVQLKDFAQWQNYGQARIFNLSGPNPVQWRDGVKLDVLRWQQASAEEPVVHTVMLAIDLTKAPDIPGNHTWRWHLAFGVGGVKREFEIDAIGAQQISVPISTADIALKSEPANLSFAYEAPNYDVSALAFVATTGVYSRLATLTQWFSLTPGTNRLLPIPNGANAWKLVGIGDTAFAVSPFVATTGIAFNVSGALGTSDEWTGAQLLPTHVLEDHIPIPGAAKNMTVANADLVNTKTVGIQWSIDF